MIILFNKQYSSFIFIFVFIICSLALVGVICFY